MTGPSGFVALVREQRFGGRTPGALEAVGRTPDQWLETPDHLVAVATSGSCRFATDRTSGVQVLLHGELLEVGPDQAQALAALIADRGRSAARELRGSFAALVVDPRDRSVSLLTDRVNSRRVYASRDDAGVWLSSSLADHVALGREVDPIGVAWYLSNGEIHAGRTLLQGVSVLERSSWTDLTGGSLTPAPYWRFEPGGERSAASEEQLSAELGELLVAAVRRTVSDDPDLYVSLSGGYDASAIVGALAFDLHVPRANCFTYVLRPGGRGTDERVAGQVASAAGYSFTTVRSYAGNLVEVIEANAEMGEGLKDFVHEVDAWRTLGPQLSALPNPVVLAGDECFGNRADYTIRNDEDVLNAIRLKGFGVLGKLESHLSTADRSVMESGMADDIGRMLARCPRGGDLRDDRDFLYLDQRLPNVVAPWREGYPLRYASLRNPLLDNDILDFVARVPSALRRTKVLFRRTVKRRYPTVFAPTRAKQSNYMLDLPGEVRRSATGLRELAARGESGLDGLIPPSVIVALLEDVLAQEAPSVQEKAKAFAKDTARSLLPPAASNQVRRFRPPVPAQPVPAALLAARLLILRLVLTRPDDRVPASIPA